MLDKSPELILDNNLIHIKNEFELNIPSLVLCSEPFHKEEFLYRLMNSIENQIIFVDMDLLYTGYVESGMIPKKNNVIIFHPEKKNWGKSFFLIPYCRAITRLAVLRVICQINSGQMVFLNPLEFLNNP